jgi:hypothetical protein
MMKLGKYRLEGPRRCTGELIKMNPRTIRRMGKYGIDWSRLPELYLLNQSLFDEFIALHPEVKIAYDEGVLLR